MNIITELQQITGNNNVIYLDKEALLEYSGDDIFRTENLPIAVCFPTDTNQVSSIVKLCAQNDIQIVPQGGRTGHAGGAAILQNNSQVIIALDKMRNVIEVDATNRTVITETGTTLHDLKEAVQQYGMTFAVNIGSELSCQIGGNIATNAGGINALRYGSLKDQVIGLEAVLPDGSIWSDLKKIKKNNAGYNINQLLTGSEGTLGIITKAVLSLQPKPHDIIMALVEISEIDEATKVFQQFRDSFETNLTAFELIFSQAFDIGTKHLGIKPPLQTNKKWMCLVEISSFSKSEAKMVEILEEMSEILIALNLENCAIADNTDKTNELWRIRHSIPTALRHFGKRIGHDIAVPISSISEFINTVTDEINRRAPNVLVAPYGHFGDGNIHFNCYVPKSASDNSKTTELEFEKLKSEINQLVYNKVNSLNGSISAEHGIGCIKTELMHKTRSQSELRIMQSIKSALDPKGIMNPGKVLP